MAEDMALLRGFAIPINGFLQILSDSVAIGIADAQIVLGVVMPLLRRQLEPVNRLLCALLHALTPIIPPA